MAYQSKYPEIIIDKDNQSPINMRKELTVEEYYDLLHHVHPGSSEDFSQQIAEINKDFNVLSEQVESIKSVLESLTNKVNEISITTEDLSAIVYADIDDDNDNNGITNNSGGNSTVDDDLDDDGEEIDDDF